MEFCVFSCVSEKKDSTQCRLIIMTTKKGFAFTEALLDHHHTRELLSIKHDLFTLDVMFAK